jgi:hypothetical protein
MLAQDLHRDGALARDHFRVVVGMDESEPAPAAQRPRVDVGLVVGIAAQHHGRSARLDRRDLDLGRGDRHHDGGAAAEPPGGERHALRVVAGGSGDDAALQRRRGELRHLVVGAAQLEREHRLQVLALEQDARAGARGKLRRGLERRLDRDVVDARGEYALQVVVLFHGVAIAVGTGNGADGTA